MTVTLVRERVGRVQRGNVSGGGPGSRTDHRKPPPTTVMISNKCTLLLLLAVVVAAKQEEHKSLSSTKDQDGADDQVTSILVHPGPDGPRHVILSNDHQVISSPPVPPLVEGFSSRAVESTNYNFPSANYPPRAKDIEFHHTVPPPLPQVTYGPARPVTLRRGRPSFQPQQLYHHRFRQSGKIPHLKAPQEDAIYKYSTYIKHDKIKELEKNNEKGYFNREHDKPDFTVTTDRESYRKPQHEGLSAYRTRDEEEEVKFRESIGDLYNHNDFEKSNDYPEKKQRPFPYSKLLLKQHNYIPNNVNYAPNKNYQSPYNTFEEDSYHDAPSGFDDFNGGKVAPVLAKFYKQPLPIIQTQLPADNVGLLIQYYQPQRSGYDNDEISNNYFEQYPQEKVSLKRDSSDSEWTPINAPEGAVPAKAYDIPAPDLSLGKPPTQKVYRRGSDDASVVIGKTKQKITSNHHIQGNSEGVVSAVVRVKQ